MPTYFLDTSAVVKRHINEPGHTWVSKVCDPVAGNSIVIAEISIVEVSAALSRMVRERPQRLSSTARDRHMTLFNRLVASEYVIMHTSRAILTHAAALCRLHPLRAYDAVQLASAIASRDDDLAVGQPVPTFVCADTVLLGVAAAEGLATANPNSYP